jgi:hypothetical protein
MIPPLLFLLLLLQTATTTTAAQSSVCACYIFVSDVFFLMRSEILSVSLKMKNFEKNLKKGDQKRQKTQGRKSGG